MRISVRGWIFTGAVIGGLLGLVARDAFAQEAAPAQLAPGQLSEEQLGQMIEAMGLKPDKQQQRYDFAFRANVEETPWELSMSAVLSQDKKSVWIMAWLDELPKSAADVPRSALLRLLADNDKLGEGKFFAYIPANRRFVLQRVIPNENLTTARFREALKDLGMTVVETHPTWSVAGWNTGTAAPETTASQAASPATGAPPVRAASNDSKFEQPIRK